MNRASSITAVMMTPIKIRIEEFGPDPKTIGIGPMKITTPVLAEPPAVKLAARSTITPTKTKIKPEKSSGKSQFGVFEVSPVSFSSVSSVHNSNHNRK